MADIQCIFQSVTGKGSIYISNFSAANNLPLLESLQIKAILSVAKNGLLSHSKQAIPHYLYIPAQDHKDYELHRYFNHTFDFIEQARKNTNVLVHCMAGISRSVTIVMAYLMKKYKTTLKEVILMVQRKRTKVNPNTGFISQLKIYAEQEGLKCDFQESEVPIPKKRRGSGSKEKRRGSSQIKMQRKQQYFLEKTTEKDEEKAQMQWKVLGQTKQDSNEIKTELQEQKIQPIGNTEKFQPVSYILHPYVKTQQAKRQRSAGKKSGCKMSIEEKINIIRDRIKKDEDKQPNIKRNNWFDHKTSGKKGPKIEAISNNLEELNEDSRHRDKFEDKQRQINKESIFRLIEHQKRQSCRHTRQTSPFISPQISQQYLQHRPIIAESKKRNPFTGQQ